MLGGGGARVGSANMEEFLQTLCGCLRGFRFFLGGGVGLSVFRKLKDLQMYPHTLRNGPSLIDGPCFKKTHTKT